MTYPDDRLDELPEPERAGAYSPEAAAFRTRVLRGARTAAVIILDKREGDVYVWASET